MHSKTYRGTFTTWDTASTPVRPSSPDGTRICVTRFCLSFSFSCARLTSISCVETSTTTGWTPRPFAPFSPSSRINAARRLLRFVRFSASVSSASDSDSSAASPCASCPLAPTVPFANLVIAGHGLNVRRCRARVYATPGNQSRLFYFAMSKTPKRLIINSTMHVKNRHWTKQ